MFTLGGGIDLKKFILAAVVLSALIGLSAAEIIDGKNYAVWEDSNSTFNFEQSVQGNGYFMTYMYTKAGNLAMKNYAHGSGSVDNEMVMSSYEQWHRWHPVGEDWNDYVVSCIQFKEDASMVYAPMSIAVGTGFYAANPIDYSSLLKEKTWIKNYLAATSIHHEIEYAHAIDKELEFTAKDKYNYTYDPELVTVGYTNFKVIEDVTDGKIHFGVLQGNMAGTSPGQNVVWDPFAVGSVTANAPFSSAWKNPNIEIDEDYWGTYHIEKNITLEVPYKKVWKTDDWLPCCFGGYLTMPTYYQKGPKGYGSNVKGVFDCTCWKQPGECATTDVQY
jgi:hypothetical protein